MKNCAIKFGNFGRQTKGKSRGLTLIELAIVLAVIGIIAVLALRGSAIMGASKGTVEGQNIFDTATATASCFTKATDYSALGATAATGTTYITANCGLEVANAPATQAGGVITNQFGGLRQVARASILGGTNNAITVTNALVPSDICQEVVQGQWGNFNSISVTPTGGALVAAKTVMADLYTPLATAACKTAVTATITLTKAKN